MRTTLILSVLLASACGRHPAAAPAPDTVEDTATRLLPLGERLRVEAGARRLARHLAHCRADATARAGPSYRRRSRAAWEAPAGPCGTHPVAGGSTSVGTSRAPVPRNGGHGVPSQVDAGERIEVLAHTDVDVGVGVEARAEPAGGVGAECEERDVAEVKQTRKADNGVQPKAHDRRRAVPGECHDRVWVRGTLPSASAAMGRDRSEVDANACPASIDREHRHAYVGDRVGERLTGLQRSVGWSGQGSGVEQDRV